MKNETCKFYDAIRKVCVKRTWNKRNKTPKVYCNGDVKKCEY